jgi:hypothetical protein
MSPLKLGKLPNRETSKITFAASAELGRLLEEYAQAYETEYRQKEAVPDLIPHMLEAFIKADRGFKKRQIKGINAQVNVR